MPATLPNDWTLERLHALPDDGRRYEIIDGELHVSPAPSMAHQIALRELVRLLLPYCDELGLVLLFAPAAVTWSDRTEVQPDVLVMPRRADGRNPSRFEDVGHLLLAAEVLSPSTMRWDRVKKKAEYPKRGVPNYWILDLASRSVESWRPGASEATILVDRLTWEPVAGVEPLRIDLPAYFARVLDD